MVRILFILNYVGLYGANRSAIELAIALKKLGQSPFFFIPQEGVKTEGHRILRKRLEEQDFVCAYINYYPSVHPGKKVDRMEKMFFNVMNEKCLEKAQDFVIKWKIDIIHTNSLTHMMGAMLAKKVKKPHVWHIREALKEDYDLHYNNKWLYRYYLRNTEQIICISDYIIKKHKEMLKGTNSVVLYNGFDIDKYIINDGYKREKEIYEIIICGLVREEKGQLEAVKAIYCLIHKYKKKNIHLKIVGDCVNDYGKKILSYIDQHDLTSYIEMIPFQENLKELRENADIALICSKNEGLGRVTIESMLSENLVIGTASGGTLEIIKDGVTGYLYQSGSAEDLCEKIYHAITHWENQECIINRAKEYAKSNFDSCEYARKVIQIYHNLI